MVSDASELVGRLALGLGLQLTPTPTLGDLRLITTGRAHLWPGWAQLSPQVHGLHASFLRHRPDHLADDDNVQRLLGGLLDAESGDFCRVGGIQDQGQNRGRDWGQSYHHPRPADLMALMTGWAEELSTRSQIRDAPQPTAFDHGLVRLVAGERSFAVPTAEIPHLVGGRPEPPLLVTSPSLSQLQVERDRLQELAHRIDSSHPGGNRRLYQTHGIDGFLSRLRRADGAPLDTLQAGPTQLAVAPTGTGKSVFARLFALHLAAQGVPVALVVPDVRTVWVEARRLSEDIAAADLGLEVAPVSSWRSIPRALTRLIDNPDAARAEVTWALNTVGYTCRLAAYADDELAPLLPGDEPCASVRQPGDRSRVSCPFAASCGRFAGLNRALTADILVVNHHAFLGGRLPFDVRLDDGQVQRPTITELVLRRCGVVLVDEIDGLQNTAIEWNSRVLVLSPGGGRQTLVHQVYDEAEHQPNPRHGGPGPSFEQGRQACLTVMANAGRLTELLNRGELAWPEAGRLIWRDVYDNWIADRLYPDLRGVEEGTAATDRLRRLYDLNPEGPVEPDDNLLRFALASLDGGSLFAEVKAALLAALTPEPVTTNARQAELSQLADRLILRGLLFRIDRALGHLRPNLPALEARAVPRAGELRDRLLGYALWQPSPTGPLGRRFYGYSFNPGEPGEGELRSQAFVGDPHLLVQQLGDQVARALAGAPRIVLGVSATGRFRGSPRFDVLSELTASVPDEATNVTMQPALVGHRISGVSGRARSIATREAARELGNTQLGAYLRRILSDPAADGRARALVVTGSYDEARHAAHGLAQAEGLGAEVRFLVNDDHFWKTESGALQRDRVEQFGHQPGPAVLVAPLSVVARGHNILQPGTDRSAISGVFVLTRPVPPTAEVGRLLAHLSYWPLLEPAPAGVTPNETLRAQRRLTHRRLNRLRRADPAFGAMDNDLRRELVCDILVNLIQLLGRARRGGTPVDLFFVDGAFGNEVAPWHDLVADVLDWWRSKGWYGEMASLHRAVMTALESYVAADGHQTPN